MKNLSCSDENSVQNKVSFKVFFALWAKHQGWTVPDIHIGICHWLETRGRVGVLEVFRGCGKSTIIAVYNAWRYYLNPIYRILHQGDQDSTAYKTSRDTKNVLQKHPLTSDIAQKIKGDVKFWWLEEGFENDPRNPSMQASGILSNIVSSRADELQNDDVEVQKNVETPEAREKLRHRLSEQIHIGVPGAQFLFVGTPHTHDSLYDEKIASGADYLKIPMYAKECRLKIIQSNRKYYCEFEPEIVMAGIGKHAKLIKNYEYADGYIHFLSDPECDTVDVYADSAWPERFTPHEMIERRKLCNTYNEWDSQYQLHAKPIGELRLDPRKIIAYDTEPRITTANKKLTMYLGDVQLVGAVAYWDCALGKVTGDVSAFSILFTDGLGRLYLHVCRGLTGDLDDQCQEIRKLVIKYQIPRVFVETNGPGGFVPPALRKHLHGTGCGVGEEHSTVNKNKRILDAWEAPLSSKFMWAHVDVLNGDLWDEMDSFNPKVKDQPDDHVDSAAGAIRLTPVRIGNFIGQEYKNLTVIQSENWRQSHGQYKIQVEK